MKMNRFFTKAAIAAIVLPWAMMSCNNDKEVDDHTIVELLLTSGVELSTRAAFPGTDVQIPSGEQVYVYVDEAGGAVQLYQKNTMTADGNGNLTGGTRMNYPVNGNNVDIYALHTNATFATAYPTTALTHTVNSDQRTLAGYAPSDLLYAKRTNVAKTPNPILLTFNHLLSKIQVAVVAGEGLTAANILGITIGGTRPQAQFTLTKAIASNAVAITAAGTAAPITIGADVSTNFTTNIRYNDAVIVPQTIAANTPLITVQLSGGSNLVYRTPASTTFERGKKYIYQITANSTGLTLTTIIVDWEPGGTVTGEATIE